LRQILHRFRDGREVFFGEIVCQRVLTNCLRGIIAPGFSHFTTNFEHFIARPQGLP
jgi:hypothetical protein